MQEILNIWFPNVITKLPDFYKSIWDTLLMVFQSGSIAFLIGILLGIILVVTRKDGICQNKAVYQILDKVINFFRSARKSVV